ncbi:MAG TPA: hypothetical protein IAC41_11270 [Candidatus Merdenecus merdavium]|nr:hypothetical protein [Candidatus Merdenecus merdavium]
MKVAEHETVTYDSFDMQALKTENEKLHTLVQQMNVTINRLIETFILTDENL